MNNVIIVAYDISDDKLRRQLSKFLERYGVRIQFSLYEIRNSKRVLDIVTTAIESKFNKRFDGGDSVYIFKADQNESIKYGNAGHTDTDLLLF
jgi:CRISPR-associated protein Cas2